MGFTQDRKAILETLRSKVQKEREIYAYWKSRLAGDPEAWEVVGAAIEALGNYYRGEGVRARRDIATFMLGLEVDQTYGEYHIVTDLKKDLQELPAFLRAIELAPAGMVLEGEKAALQLKLEVIKENTKIVKREIYAG